MISAFVGYRAFETRRTRPGRSRDHIPLETRVVDAGPYSRDIGAALLSSIDILLACGIFLVSAEVMLTSVGVVAGAVSHAVLIAVLLFRSTMISPPAHEGTDNALAQHFLYQLSPILVLVSLLRILSLVIPHRDISQIYWLAMIGAPLLLAAALTARRSGLSWHDVGIGSHLNIRSSAGPVLIAASGVPLGLAAFATLQPESALVDVEITSNLQLILSASIIVLFVGFLEELLFRGLLQQTASQIIGGWALPWASVIYAAMYLGSGSIEFVLFMGLVGLFFGWYFQRTRSLWSVTMAHSLMSIGMLLVYPAL